MSRAGRRPTPEGDERRERIRRAASEVLAADGFDAVTHRRVAARAGAALGSVAYYFGSRDDLLVAAVEALAEPWLANARAVAADPPDDLADALVRLVAGDAGRQELQVQYERLVQAARMPALAARTTAWTDELVALADGVLRDAGHDALTPRAAVALVDGLLLHALADPLDAPLTAARDELRRVLTSDARR
jgi:DNA-binding transcriptional regulator YbjK